MGSTVQLPGGERVPFLFTVKNLVAKADSGADIDAATKFSGTFKVPSYRTGLFLDPKGRGTTTGYDQAVALPAMQAGGDEGMFKENNKKFEVLDGSIEFKVTGERGARRVRRRLRPEAALGHRPWLQGAQGAPPQGRVLCDRRGAVGDDIDVAVRFFSLGT